MSDILINIAEFIVMILIIVYSINIVRRQGFVALLNNIGIFLSTLFVFYILFIYIPDRVINRDEYKQQTIQNNTETVLIDGKECVIYDDGGLFSGATIDCDWGDDE